jgi:hypothetical protein
MFIILFLSIALNSMNAGYQYEYNVWEVLIRSMQRRQH